MTKASPAPDDDARAFRNQEQGAPATIGAQQFHDAHGEYIEAVLALPSWEAGINLEALYRRLEAEVAPALDQQRRIRNTVRDRVFPRLAERPAAPADAGVYQATPEQLASVHRRVLFGGQLEACDGTVVSHDTLVLTVTQIGICLVSYLGDQLSLSQRLFRRDLRTSLPDPVDEVLAVLDRRADRGAPDSPERADTMSDLTQRGIMAYAERAVLVERGTGLWRMGHGIPAPYELLTGSGSMELLEAGLKVVRELVEDHRRYVFVPSTLSDRPLLTIGDALRPLEYAVLETTESRMLRIVARGHYERARKGGRDYGALAESFAAEVGPQIVLGMYRASEQCPARPFFAHPDHVHEAALVAMADSVLQEHRGFPLSIDLAHAACTSMFGPDTFDDAVRSAYHQDHEPLRYLNERETRK